MKLGQRFQEFIYSIRTNDKYSEFDSRKSFNRINKPKADTEASLLGPNTHSTGDILIDLEFEKHKLDGVHEVRLAWRHIKNWLDNYSPDLNSSLQKACTEDDLSDFQKDLGVVLPNCVIEFFKLTDGQDSDDFNTTGGLFYGLKLMSLDEITVMTENWRKVSKKFTTEMSQLNSNKVKALPKLNSYRFSNSSVDLLNEINPDSSNTSLHSIDNENDLGTTTTKVSSERLNVSPDAARYPSQRSIPPGTIHPIFAHPMWIPMITDKVGNCIGIDLSPPNTGKGVWGQVILFGREFDTKFLIADNFGDFLLIFANDLEKGNWDMKLPEKNNYGDLMIGNEGDLVYIDKETSTEVGYLTVLQQRCIKRWIDSLDKEELDDDTKVLINDLKLNSASILNVKTLNDNAIDDFINKNLNLVNGMLDPINHPELKTLTKDKPLPPLPTTSVEPVQISTEAESAIPADANISVDISNQKTESI